MDKEQILKYAKENKYKGTEFENNIFSRSIMLSQLCAIFVSLLLIILDYVVNKSIDIRLLSIIATILGSQLTFEGIKIKKRLSVILGIIFLIVSVILVAISIWRVII
ncbi:MAG: hypothetical protein IJF14_00215 [Clostridia bacterium]|nr:hypothetical protein [Clostridia bacterium]